MRRKSAGTIREIAPDRKFNSVSLSKMINKIMLHGKKSIAEKIVYGAMDSAAKELLLEDQMALFNKVIENVQPRRMVVARRFGGTTYSVPKEIPTAKRLVAAIKLIIDQIEPLVRPSKKKVPGMEQKRRVPKTSTEVLSSILVDSYNNTGPAVAAKNALQKLADANEAFAHFVR